MKRDLNELWSKFCQDDDVKAFEEFYYAMFKKLLNFSIHYTSNPEVGEEIVSEIFVKCWNNRKSLISVAKPETYMFVAVKNQSLKYLKKASSVHLVDIEGTDEHHFADASADPSHIAEGKELRKQLDAAIETLPAQAKLVFQLIKEGGMKYKEVAELLDISHRTVQTHLFRSIDKLRQILRNYSVPKLKEDNQNTNKLVNIVALTTFLQFIYIFLESCRQFLA